MTTTSRLQALLHQVGADQRNGWLRGDRRLVESYLQEWPELAADLDGLLDLVLAEYWLREDVGESPTIEEFVTRFPRLGAAIRQTLSSRPQSDRGSRSRGQQVDAEEPTELYVKNDEANVHAPSTQQPFDTAVGAPAGDYDRFHLPQIPGYRIARELGRGMGIVYEAYDIHRKRWVALKTIRTPDDPRALHQFKQEFRVLCDLAHPNLVNFYELVSDGDVWFFTMELVAGVDFLTYVREAGAASPGSLDELQVRRLRDVLVQLVRGVNAVHQFGKLHRDLKPGNVMVSGDGRVVILDFGLAASLDAEGLHQVTEQHIVGTLLFMAPEQAAADVVSPASDWYCLGVMLYQALTGRLPFEGKPLSVLQRKQIHDAAWDAGIDAPSDLVQLCMDLLQRSPETRPSGQEILSRLGDTVEASKSDAPSVVATLPFKVDARIVGRETELEILRRSFASVQDGGSVTLFVNGPSGFGKSSLIESFLQEIADGAWIFRGRCFERELVPYKAVDSMIDALGQFLLALPATEVKTFLPRYTDALATLFPVLRRVPAIATAVRTADSPDPAESRRRGFASLRELFARLSNARAVVIAIDDVQWGDADSEQLLAEIVQLPDAPRMLLLLNHRQEDAAESPFLRSMTVRRDKSLGWDNARELRVGSLPESDVRRLVATVVEPEHPQYDQAVDAALRESDGSPLFVLELAWSVIYASGDTEDQPARLTLDEVLWQRVQRLSPACRRLMEIVAVASRPIPASLAFAAADVASGESAALDELRFERLIRISQAHRDESVESYHDRVRESVMRHLPPQDLEERHRRLAQAMAGRESNDPECVAVHWHAAGELQVAGPLYSRAAKRAAEALAFDRAAQLYRRALENPALSTREETNLKVQLGHALANAGRGGEAAVVYQEAAAASDELDGRRFARLAATQFLLSGRVDDGLHAMNETLIPMGWRLPRSMSEAMLDLVYQTVRLKCRGLSYLPRAESAIDDRSLEPADALWSTSIGLGMVNPMYASLFVKKHLRRALDLGEPKRIAQGLAYEAVFYGTLGPRYQPSVDRYLAMAEQIGRNIGDDYVAGFCALGRGITEYMSGRFLAGHEQCVLALHIFQNNCTGAVWETDTASIYSAWSLLNAGRWKPVFNEIERVTRIADSRQDLYLQMNWVDFVQVYYELSRDEPERARAVLDSALDRWSRQGFFLQHILSLMFRVFIDLYQDEGVNAWQTLDANWSRWRSASFHRIHMTRVFMNELRGRASLAAARSSAGAERQRRLADAARAVRVLRRERALWPTSLAHLLEAQIEFLRGGRQATLEKLAVARRSLQSCDGHFYCLAAQRHEGILRGGAEGDQLVQEADAHFLSEGVYAPRRLASMHAPAFDP